MVLRLESLPKKLGAIALVAVASAPVSASLFTTFRTEQFRRAGTADSLAQALALQPQNAQLHNHLGRILLYSPEGDSRQAELHLERATALDPRSGDYWTDLALAREMRGDVNGAGAALARAHQAEPRTPLIEWHSMNFLLRRGETERALESAGRLLQAAPDYTTRVVPVLSNAIPMDRLIETIVPSQPRVLCDLLAVIARSRDHAGAARAWDRTIRSGAEFRAACFQGFLDSLIAAGDAGLAQRVWKDSIQRGWLAADRSALEPVFYNGDFRYPLLNSGFDWRVTPQAEASVWIEARGPEPGQQSVCIEFAPDAKSDYSHLSRYIPVEPNTDYLIRAHIRSDRLESRQGAYLWVQEVRADAAAPAPLLTARSDTWSGTNRWKEIAFRFTAGPQTRLVLMQLRRPGVLATEPSAAGTTCLSAVDWSVAGRAPQNDDSVRGGRP